MSNLPDAKELKKLVKLCREMGIKSYKGENFEFVLADDAPPVKTRKSKNLNAAATQDSKAPDATFESDAPTEESLLFWSTGQGGVPFTVEANATS